MVLICAQKVGFHGNVANVSIIIVNVATPVKDVIDQDVNIGETIVELASYEC